MMYGTREEFEYLLCDNCGCLQISEIPDNIAQFYPSDYYSYSSGTKKKRWLRDLTRKYRNLYAIEGKGFLGSILSEIKSPAPLFRAYGRTGIDRDASILDVGGGSGTHVRELHALGIKNATAIDPFIERDVIENGRTIARKLSIFEVEGPFDLITFHHSFEHMDKPKDILIKAGALLAEGGSILMRIPTVTSDAFDEYGANWSDLDAPRHFYLHSHRSIRLLAESAGLMVTDFWCDSNAFQFWASKQYAADIPLNDPRSYSMNPAASIFSQEDMKAFERRAVQANKALRGDAISLILKATK